jgi:hypothetical protein
MNLLERLRHYESGGTGPVGISCGDAADEIERLRAALEKCMVGGNHIAIYKTARWPEVGSDHEHALRILHATPAYDMWCCWSAIMQARDLADLETV